MATDIKTAEKITVSLQPPSRYKVIFQNDNQTPMEFVIELLVTIFKHSESAAKDITLEIHNEGSAVAGVFNHEIAEHKAVESTSISRLNGFPLQINIEKE
jgi:ATP-dependent Clp protease adaptor protein ClpS